MITLWHNPRCSKSRAALALLQDRGIAVTIRRYLEDTPTSHDIEAVLHKLGLPAQALLRTGEKPYKDLNLATCDDPTTLIDAMAEHPILIERPIAIHGSRAIIGRPPETVLSLLD